MRIVVAGASGLIGRALTARLSASGHRVQRLVRRNAVSADEIAWDPVSRRLEPAALEGIDAIVNLAGENIASGRWSAARRQRITRSRLDATSTLVQAMAEAMRPPGVFVNASAVGFYGDRGDEILAESAAKGQGFLPTVCQAWEAHAAQAATLGVRTVLARFGIVLARDGGALGRMLPLFRLGLGGQIGAGRQWMSWISRQDAVGALEYVLQSPVVGPVNVVAPTPVTNAEFTRTLARALRRPAFVPAPAWALRLAFGAMADEALLASTRAQPAVLETAAFAFRHRTLDAALAAVIG